ncbi:MAG: RagB/SusD family nutrient uptake outer membrane protein, partial [Bacteroides sp.]
GRELYWEGTRRTDLVRYDYYTSGKYVWQFKGGVKQGTGIEAFRNVFPIPSTDLSVNNNLTQNTGY